MEPGLIIRPARASDRRAMDGSSRDVAIEKRGFFVYHRDVGDGKAGRGISCHVGGNEEQGIPGAVLQAVLQFPVLRWNMEK